MVLVRYCYEQNINKSCKEELKWRARITCCKSPAKEKQALTMVVSREENEQLWCFLFDVQDLSAVFLRRYKLAKYSGKTVSCSSEPCLGREHLRHVVELEPWFFMLLSELMNRTCNIVWYAVHYILVPNREYLLKIMGCDPWAAGSAAVALTLLHYSVSLMAGCKSLCLLIQTNRYT